MNTKDSLRLDRRTDIQTYRVILQSGWSWEDQTCHHARQPGMRRRPRARIHRDAYIVRLDRLETTARKARDEASKSPDLCASAASMPPPKGERSGHLWAPKRGETREIHGICHLAFHPSARLPPAMVDMRHVKRALFQYCGTWHSPAESVTRNDVQETLSGPSSSYSSSVHASQPASLPACLPARQAASKHLRR